MKTTETTTQESLRLLAKRKRRKAREAFQAAEKKKLDELKEDQRKYNKPKYPFQPGQSGNPAGRPKGSKNKLTLLREAVLASSEEIVLENLEEIVKATVTLAKKGDPTCLKIIWDRVIPSKRAIEDKSKGEDRLNISINISGMDVEEHVKKFEEDVDNEPLEAEFMEIKTNV